MAATYIYKPNTYKGPVFLAPDNTDRGQAPTITGPDGKTYTGRYYNTNEGRHQFIFPRELYGMQGLKVNYGGQTGSIDSGGQSYEGNDIGGWQARQKGSLGGGGGGYDPTAVGGGYGFAPADLTGQFPSPIFGNYTNTKYKNIRAPGYKFTDPIEFGKAFGEFNRGEIKKNLDFTKGLALDELDTELKGLQGYAPAAAALSRSETSIDNQFNQSQREAQVGQALPNARGDFAGQRSRALSYASGQAPDSITDRALELGARSQAADLASSGGFGARSSAGQKLSNLMSADERIRLSQYGDQLLSSNINQEAGLFLAPTEYANLGSQIKATPEIGGARLQAGALSEVNNLTTLNPATALNTTVQQHQYETSLEQDTRKFNASNTLQNAQFNAGNNLQLSEFNASAANQFGLAKFGYQVGLAGAYAGAYQTDMNTQVGLQQQAQYGQIFSDYASQAQGAAQTGAIAQGVGAAIPAISGAIQAGAGLIDSLFGGGSAAPDIAPSGGGDYSVGAPTVSGGQDLGTPIGGQSTGDFSYQPSSPGGFLDYQGSAPSSGGYELYGGYGGGGGGGGPVGTFAADMSIPKVGTIGDPNGAVTRALLTQSGAVMNTAGIYSSPQANSVPVGVSNNGGQVYGSIPLLKNDNASEGTGFVSTFKDILSPLGVFSNEGDNAAISKVGVTAGDAKILSDLTEHTVQGDTKGFVNRVLDAFGQPPVDVAAKSKEGLTTAYSAYQLAQNWDRMSPAQRSLGLASIGLQSYKFGTGENLADKKIIEPSNGNPGLSVGQGLALMQQGYNTYSLAKNWGQINTLQKVAAGAGNAAQLARLARGYGMLGSGTNGAEVGGVTAASLAQSGWTPAPSLGVGAITSSSTAGLPQGYSVVSNQNGVVVATPPGTKGTAVTAQNGGTLSTIAGVAGATLGAQRVYSSWGQGGTQGAINGALGGSAMAAGLNQLGETNPYVQGAIVAASVFGAGSKNKTVQAGAGAVGAGALGYSGYNAVAGSGAGAASSFAGPAAAIAGGVQGYQILTGNGTDKQKAQALNRAGEDAGAAVGTLGLSSLAQLGDHALGGHIDKARTRYDNSKYKPLVNPVGAANEFAVSKALQYSGGQKSGAQGDRDEVRSHLKNVGLVGGDYNLTLADGTKFNIGVDGHGGEHSVYDSSKLVKEHEGMKKLNAWDTDYTNDLDYTAGLAGNALSRILTGSKGTGVDQVGAEIGNALLGNVGFGKEMNAGNFGKVSANMRAVYSQAGIKSKADAYQLANQAFAEGRIDESDLHAMQNTFNVVFDKSGFDTAQKLMSGRYKGIDVATSTTTAPSLNTTPAKKLPAYLKPSVYRPGGTVRSTIGAAPSAPMDASVLEAFGVPKDQAKRFKNAQYQPLRIQGASV